MKRYKMPIKSKWMPRLKDTGPSPRFVTSYKNAMQHHADSAHKGLIDPECRACKEIQERYK